MAWRFVFIFLFASFASLRAQDFSFVNYGFTQGLRHSQIIDITQDNYGNLWVLPLTGTLLYRFDGRDFQKVNVVIDSVDQNVRLFSIAADKNDNIWIATSIGLVRYDGRKFHREESTPPVDLSRQNRAKEIPISKNETLILSQGSISLKTEKGIVAIEDRPNFTNKFITRIFKDRSNSIWLCTDSQGIFNLTKQKTVNIPVPNSDIPVSLLPLDSNRFLAGTYKAGLVEINGTHVKDLGFKELQGKIVMTAVKGPNNTVLIGTQQNGAFALSNNKLKRIDLGDLRPNFVLPITMFDNEVWIGSSFGLHRLSNSLKTINTYSYKQLGSGAHFNFILPLDSMLLIGSSGDGVFLFDPKTEVSRKLDGYQRESAVWTVKTDSIGNIWLGGEFPRIVVLNNALERTACVDVSKYCSNVLAFEFLDKNQLLVGSNDGIFTFSLDKDHKISAARKLGATDGYKGGEVCMASMVRVKNKIWFATSDGAYCYSIGNEIEDNTTPNTYINSVRLFNQETDWTKYSADINGMFGLPANLELHHENNNLTFSFYANDFHDNEDLQFHYWLEGSDTGWSEFSAAENITYSALRPGKYTFKVQSKDGFSSGNVASFSFVILPAFWETNTFYLIAAVSIIAIVYSFIRISTHLRIKRFQLKEQIRATESAKLRRQMAMDFHDEMGNKLASVLAYSSSLKIMSTTKESHELFDYFEKAAAAIYYGTKDFIWSIDVESNNLREVIAYLRDFGVNFFEKHGIEFHVENDILNEHFSKSLPDGYNRQLILLFKEAMTNVLKHSNASMVHFDVIELNGQCKITLEDDGVGIQSRNGKGKGLRGMADRAAKISADLLIDAKQPHGTRVALQFKA